MIYLLVFLTVIAGMVLLVLAWIRAHVERRPRCAQCKYDLRGNSSVGRCPECGRDLAAQGAVETVHRRLNRRYLVPGLVCSGIATVMFLAFAVAAVRGADFYQWLPASYLAWEVERAPARTNSAADELRRRLDGNLLSDEQVAAAIDRGLRRQANTALAWPNSVGDFLEAAFVLGHGTQEQRQEYVKNGVVVGVSMRQRARASAPVPVTTMVKEARLGRQTDYMLRWHVLSLRLAGEVWENPHPGGYFGMGFDPRSTPSGVATSPAPRAPSQAAEGEATLHLRIGLARRNVLIGEHDLEKRFPMQVVAEDEPVIELVDAPELQEEIRRSLTITATLVATGKPEVQVKIAAEHPPLPLAFDVFVILGDGREIPVGSLRSQEGVSTIPMLLRWDLDEIEPPSLIDLALRANPVVAETWTLDFDRIWSGEIILRDVPVRSR